MRKREIAQHLGRQIKEAVRMVTDAQEAEIVNHLTQDELDKAQNELERALAVILGEQRRRWVK